MTGPAGPIRNAQMADMRPDVVLAAPGKVGTANMIEAARTRGLNVVMLERMPVVRTYEKGATSGATPSP
jgi:precorrin-6x reductase